MTLNEKLAQILAIAEDDRRQESVSRAEKNKPKLIEKLIRQAKRGCTDGLLITDDDSTYVTYLAEYFKKEGFQVGEVERNRYMVAVSRS